MRAQRRSAAKKRAYASLRECFVENMDDDKRQALFDMLYKRALQGNLRAFEIIRDTMGERPTVSISANAPSQAAIDAVEAFIRGECVN